MVCGYIPPQNFLYINPVDSYTSFMDEVYRQQLLKLLYEQALQEQAAIGNANLLKRVQQQEYFNASRPREMIIPMSENARIINKMYPPQQGETLQDLLKKLGGAPVSPGENF